MWRKSQDCENEVKVKLSLPDWHVHLTIFLQTKYSWPMTCSNWRTDNDENVTQVTGPWKWGHNQVTPATDIYTLQCINRPNIVDLSLIVIEKHICSWKCDASHWTVKMRSRSSDTCQTDMYTIQYIYRPNIDDLYLTVIEKQTCSRKCDTSHWTVNMRSRSSDTC
jgi:uncharacterized protein (DUF427 family)